MKRISFIVNPFSGRRAGIQILDRVRQTFAASGVEIEVFVTKASGHARELARSMPMEGRAGLGVIGGDGTVHEVIDGLMRRTDQARPPLGLIPGGSANTIHQHLRLVDPADAARAIANGVTGALDIARVTTESGVVYAFDLIGWGLAADVNRTAEKLRWLGPSRYTVVSVLALLRARRRRARVILDGQAQEGEFLLVIACNTAFAGDRLKMCPQAEIDDGRIDVVIVRPASRWQLIAFFRKAFRGAHLSLPFVSYRQARFLAIEQTQKESLDIDGEIEGTAPAQIQVLPSALRVFVKAEMRNSNGCG